MGARIPALRLSRSSQDMAIGAGAHICGICAARNIAPQVNPAGGVRRHGDMSQSIA